MDVAALIERYLPEARFTSKDNEITSWDETCGHPQPSQEDLDEFQTQWDEDELERAREYMLMQINRETRRALESITKPYDEHERETWYKQEEQAKKWLDDPTADTVFLDNCAIHAGVSKEDLVARIMGKVIPYEAATGIIQGKTLAKRAIVKDPNSTLEIVLSVDLSYS